MVLLDTHTWLWWVAEPKKLSAKAKAAINHAKKRDAVFVSAFSCWEVAMLVAHGRLGLSLDVSDWVQYALSFPEIRLVDLKPQISVSSTQLAGTPPKDPADRILIATAKYLNCPIVSKDRLIRNYEHVETVW